ncbi:unnamed protein product [Mytilus edulis]|uniref:Ig-like domain-containing protein n=1 Tax=Mytilus edulis TaxID=6550 RepID=A0A8S3VCW2_MYTED|nr:unnamed protein product [Mytilus edulis]
MLGSQKYLTDTRFSTKDRDNDDMPTAKCTDHTNGGWWYQGLPERWCTKVNPNGRYSVDDSTTSNPEQPDSLPSYVLSAGIEEGNNVVFTCTGNVGKPQGKFRWVRYRRNSDDVTVQETPYESEITTAAPMPGTCTYNGTSSLTLKMTQIDNNAVFRCQVVYQDVTQGSLYKQTFPINVYCK